MARSRWFFVCPTVRCRTSLVRIASMWVPGSRDGAGPFEIDPSHPNSRNRLTVAAALDRISLMMILLTFSFELSWSRAIAPHLSTETEVALLKMSGLVLRRTGTRGNVYACPFACVLA